MSQGTRGDRLSRVAAAAGAAAQRPPKRPLRMHRRVREGGRRPMPEDKVSLEEPFAYEIVGADHPEVVAGRRLADDEMVVMIKRAINASGMSRRDMQEFVGDDGSALFKNPNQAYNLEYGLRSRGTITLDCALRWAQILGKRLRMELVDEEEPQGG